jgi:hypothetical protein
MRINNMHTIATNNNAGTNFLIQTKIENTQNIK